jgi:CheY-like chemotaxis protein
MRVLLVANQTLGGVELADHLAELKGADPELSIHVLVPAAVIGVIADPTEMLSLLAVDVEAERREAEERMNTLLDWLRRGGVTATGEIAVAQPLLAVATVVRAQSFDRVVLSTFPAGVSRWLRMDLAHRVKRVCNLPVTTIINTVGQARPPELTIVAPRPTPVVDIALVDADVARRVRIRTALEQVSVPLRVTECDDAAGALRMLTASRAQHRGALVCLPTVDCATGLGALSEIKAGYPDLSASVLSETDDPEARRHAHELGASAFFVLGADERTNTEMFEIVATEFIAIRRLLDEDDE